MFSAVSSYLPAIYWIVLSGSFLTIGDIVFRVSLGHKWELGYGFTLLVYIIGGVCMMMSFFQQNIAIATVAAVVINTILYLVAAYLLYGDTISVWQGIGIALGLAALVVLELSAT